MSRRAYGVAATITGAIFTIMMSLYPEPLRESISNLFGASDEAVVMYGLSIIAGIWILAGILLLADSLRPTKTTKISFDPKFKHVSARLFYTPKRWWHRKRVTTKHWWEISKQTPSRHKLILVNDLKRAYLVGKFAWNLIIEGKIEWFSEEDQDLDEWCTKEDYTPFHEEADEKKLLEPYFEAEIVNKKTRYMRSEAVFFMTHYRGKLVSGFFDNQITPLSDVTLPNGRPSYWSWSPDTLPNPYGEGKLDGYVNHTSRWDWQIPPNAPVGKYRIIMGVNNHFDINTRPRVAHKEETIIIVSRSGKSEKSTSKVDKVTTDKSLIEAYSPIHAMIVRINREIPRESALQLTVGMPVKASLIDVSSLSTIFNQHIHDLRDRDLKMWIEIEKQIEERGFFWMGRDLQMWFDELEAEYNRLTRHQTE